MTPDLQHAALHHLPALLAMAGLPPEGWRHRPIMIRDESSPQVVVLRLTRPGAADLALKYKPGPARSLADRIAEHQLVQRLFPHDPQLTVPRLLAHDAAHGVTLMEHFDGVPLADLLGPDIALADHAAVLARAGRWLAAFHRARLGDARIFRPKYGLQSLDQVIKEIGAGRRRVAEQARFLRAAAGFAAMHEDWRHQQTRAAAQHADLHMRNLLMGSTAVAGIDFAGGHTAPVGHDIARLLVDYTAMAAPLEDLRRGEVVPEAALAGFFGGYDVVGPDDPSVRMMLRMRILTDWRGLPASPENMSPTKARRLVGLMRMADMAFDL